MNRKIGKKNKIPPFILDVDFINNNADSVMKRLSGESLAVYKFLADEWQKGDSLDNKVFQFVFRSFYRIDNAGLTDPFKQQFFKLMEGNRQNPAALDISAVCRALYAIPRHKNDHSLQFSFVTKMANTLDNHMPIYDSEVARMYGFRPPAPNMDLEERIKRLMEFYGFIKDDYERIIRDGVLGAAINKFDIKFPDSGITPNKKIDFIVWSAGKIYKK